ncbi:hypothetical protein F7725_018407 [Dissostichus mawsoni]|uniref:Uncharacterized protein n=1 Tax=Dissostichus mawsoni TaxID=36200 RepID=A0A7J5XRH2_DISMA|nr:hypothetical protein F7725_018407 [Dissostichus mawsoni]
MVAISLSNWALSACRLTSSLSLEFSASPSAHRLLLGQTLRGEEVRRRYLRKTFAAGAWKQSDGALTWSNFFCLFSRAVQFCLSLCRARVMSSISSLSRSLCRSTLSFSSFCRSFATALSSSLWSFLRVSSPASTAVFTSSDCLRSSAS